MSIDATPRLRALGIDVDDIWRKAGESASLAMRDKALYGFHATDRSGRRIDPRTIRPARATIFDYAPTDLISATPRSYSARRHPK